MTPRVYQHQHDGTGEIPCSGEHFRVFCRATAMPVNEPGRYGTTVRAKAPEVDAFRPSRRRYGCRRTVEGDGARIGLCGPAAVESEQR